MCCKTAHMHNLNLASVNSFYSFLLSQTCHVLGRKMATLKCYVFQLMFCLLSLLGSAAACRSGTPSECEKVPFVPGYNLAGEGFDVVKMRRKGAYLINVKTHLTDNGTCTLCENRFQGGQVQKLPAMVLDWRPFSRCSKQLSSALHHTVDSLVKSSSALINNNWGIDLNLHTYGKVLMGGSRSDIAKFARTQHNVDKATFALHEITCTYYRSVMLHTFGAYYMGLM